MRLRVPVVDAVLIFEIVVDAALLFVGDDEGLGGAAAQFGAVRGGATGVFAGDNGKGAVSVAFSGHVTANKI